MNQVPAKGCPTCGERYDVDVLFCPRDGTPLTSARSSSLPGSSRDPYLDVELAGQIRIEHLVGIGSMGRVYRAFQAGIDRHVAVKILHRELSGNAELVTRFHREAKVASRLVHPNVVQVLMTGTVPFRAEPVVGGELFLVMEYLDGLSLLSALAASGTADDAAALPLPRALHIILQICDAVGEAHAQSIVHRDMKPENVMLVRRGDDPDYVKVLDFGIARLDWADKAAATQAGLIFGTAKYISPEGAEGKRVGPQADVYSIATMLYQCLAGRAPFEGDSPVALLVQHTHAPAPELRSIARSSYVPAPIAEVVMRNLAKSPTERARCARTLGRELMAAARASGLRPDEFASFSGLTPHVGRVKLDSNLRTKQLELSPELADRMAGRESAPDAEARATPLPHEASPPQDRCSTAPPARASVSPTSPSAPPEAHARPSAPSRTALGTVPPEALDVESRWMDASLEPTSAPAHGMGTIQGAELGAELDPPPPRSRLLRLLVIAAFSIAVPIAVMVGGRHLGAFGAPVAEETAESALETARDCMRRHAWDGPPGQNVKDVTDRALARWPGEPRVVALRREAAGRIVMDAVGSKYAGDRAGALRLASLALELQPALTTAQHLVAELGGSPTPVGPPSDEPAVAPSGRPLPPRVHRPPAASAAASAKAAPVPVPIPPPPEPVPPASAAPAPQPTGSPELPPPPPPLATDHAPTSAPPAGTGPWL